MRSLGRRILTGESDPRGCGPIVARADYSTKMASGHVVVAPFGARDRTRMLAPRPLRVPAGTPTTRRAVSPFDTLSGSTSIVGWKLLYGVASMIHVGTGASDHAESVKVIESP